MITYELPVTMIEHKNKNEYEYEGERIVDGRLRVYNKNGEKWEWFDNPRPARDKYTLLADRKTKSRYFSNFEVEQPSPLKETK